MRTPRELLILLFFALVAIGAQTLLYPPEELAFSFVWSVTTSVAGLSCAAAAVRPRRIYVAVSGATVVTSSCARGLALLAELLRLGHEGPTAALLVASITWGLVALLAFVVWREYVLPWSVTTESHRSSTRGGS